MQALMNYMKGYLILFFILMVLTEAAGGHYRKYISFFARMLLVLGLLYPVLNWTGEADMLKQQIEYETFWQQLEEARLYAEKITYQDNYVKSYEDAIALDMTQMAESYQFAVKEITVTMTKQYEIDRVEMTLSDPEKENIVIGKIEWNGEEQKETQTKEYAYQKLKEQLIRYYQLSEEQLDIVYQG